MEARIKQLGALKELESHKTLAARKNNRWHTKITIRGKKIMAARKKETTGGMQKENTGVTQKNWRPAIKRTRSRKKQLLARKNTAGSQRNWWHA